MLKKIFLCAILSVACVGVGFSQDEKKTEFKDSGLPRSAASTDQFVPAGWMIEETIKGDLNADKVDDTVLVLIEKPAAGKTADTAESRERALMVLFAGPKGELQRIATAKHLLICTACGGMLGGDRSASDITIVKGVLIVKTLTGSRESTDTTFRFRFDPKVGKLALIGFDQVDNDRGTGASTSTSTNYLTGEQVTEELQYDQKLDKDVRKSTSHKKVSKPIMYLQDVDYDEMVGGD